MATARTDTGELSPAPGREPRQLGAEVLGAIRVYLTTRFPIASQGVTVLCGYVCAYLLYGQAHGEQVFGWPTVVGGLTGVLLSLVRRLVDDVEDFRGDVRSGRLSFPDGGRRHLRGLVGGALAVTAVVAALNATCGPALLLLSVGLAAWIPIATVTRNLVAREKRALFFLINESCPALGLIYPYAVWHQVSGATLPALAVISLSGLFWVSYEFWNFTRKVGKDEGWPPWGLTLDQTRVVLVAYLALAAAFSVLVAHYFHLAAAYVVYGVGLSVVYATVILRWWSRLPAREPERVGGGCGGVRFGVAVQLGLFLALAVS